MRARPANLKSLVLSGVAWLAVSMGACSRDSGNAANTDLQCVPRGLGAEGLGSEWQGFAEHVHTCLVVEPNGIPALEIISTFGQPAQRDAAPLPLILLPGGRLVGRLPHHYPRDAGRPVQLRFEDWQRGIPQRIVVRMEDPSGATGADRLVLRWDVRDKVYDEPH